MRNQIATKSSESAPLLVDADTLAARYGIAAKTVRKWGADGTLPFIKISRRCCRYPVDACDRIIMARRVNAISES
jgi:predicted site-specific integrase-resolvase